MAKFVALFSMMSHNSDSIVFLFALQSYPIAWVLMSKRTIQSHKAVFGEIKELFPDFKPKVVITDFEKGLREALRQSFNLEDDDVIGCHFHYAQVLFFIISMVPVIL